MAEHKAYKEFKTKLIESKSIDGFIIGDWDMQNIYKKQNTIVKSYKLIKEYPGMRGQLGRKAIKTDVSYIFEFKDGRKLNYEEKYFKDFQEFWQPIEEEDFERYVEEYLNQEKKDSIITNWLNDYPARHIQNLLNNKKYELIPFEIKIGILKYICDDFDWSLMHVISTIAENDKEALETLFNICPFLFIDSIFKK